MKKPIQKLLLFNLVLVLWLGVTSAGEIIDRVAALVDDDIILLSEIDETVFLLASKGQLSVRDSTELAQVRRQILDRLIEDTLIIHRAKNLGMKISEAEISPQVEEAVQKIRSNFPDENAFNQALEKEGVTINMLRERYTTEIRNERLRQIVVGNEIRSQAEVTTEDVQAYYEEKKSELPDRADDVHLRQMLFRLQGDEQETQALGKATALREALVGGASFAVAAEGYQSVTTPQRFCKGDLDPAMEAALTTLQAGEISEPVRSAVGYTIFQMTERDGDCYKVLFAVVGLEADPLAKAEAMSRAQAARERVLGDEAFGDVARELSEDSATSESGGDMGFVTLDGVPPDIAELLNGLELNEISPVVEAPDGLYVFQVLERREGGEYAFEEIQEQLRQYLENERFQEAYKNWLAAVRESSYVEIKAWSR